MTRRPSRRVVWSRVVFAPIGFASALAFALPVTSEAQVGGNLAALPAVELTLDITSGSNGPELSATEFELVTGDYYRMNLTSDGIQDWRFEADDLLQNSHLRLVTIGGIEVHLQGLAFRAIELDEAGTAEFTFTPIRPGTYAFSVGEVPSAVGQPIGSAGVLPEARRVEGRFIVR